MHAVALRFSWDGAASSGPRLPSLLLFLVCVASLGRRLLKWILTPLQTAGILEEAPEDPLTLWPITPFANTSSLSAIDNTLQTIRQNLAAVVEYGSLGADRQEDITCAVCLTDFRATDRIRRLAKCGHVFHMDCLDQWIDYQRNSCPLCRSPTS